MPKGIGYRSGKTKKKKKGIMSHGEIIQKLIKSGTKPGTQFDESIQKKKR